MAKVLYVEASPRKKRSSSIAIANHFLDAYRGLHPEDEILTVDLWKKDLPSFDGDVIDAKYAIMNAQSPTEAQKRAWKPVETLIAEFKSVDKYVFSLPMWNFGIPYRLKQYIDILVQPTYLFSYSPSEGYKGLITGKKVFLIYARGGVYRPGTGAEHLNLQSRYMETILQFVGFQDIRSLAVESTTGPAEEKEKNFMNAQEEARRAAAQF